jgi:hypothetical protein
MRTSIPLTILGFFLGCILLTVQAEGAFISCKKCVEAKEKLRAQAEAAAKALAEEEARLRAQAEGRSDTLFKAIEVEGGNFAEYIQERGGTLEKATQTEIGNLEEFFTNPPRVDEFIDGRIATLPGSLQTETQRGVDFLKSRTDTLQGEIRIDLQHLRKHIDKLYLQSPDAEETIGCVSGQDCTGRPIYFMNGVFTTHEDARKSAEALSAHLGRPVRLIHNTSTHTI